MNAYRDNPDLPLIEIIRGDGRFHEECRRAAGEELVRRGWSADKGISYLGSMWSHPNLTGQRNLLAACDSALGDVS